jgi:hypothetical protein
MLGCAEGVKEFPNAERFPSDRSVAVPMMNRVRVGPFAATSETSLATPTRIARVPGRFQTSHKTDGHRLLFLNGNLTSNVDVYSESGEFISECEGCGGWGLAAYAKNSELAIGAYGGLVTVWTVGSPMVPIATLGLSRRAHGAEALGLAFDAEGNLFASNYPANTIDEFSAATIKAGGGEPDSTFRVRGFAEVYYLATAGTHLLLDGWDPSYNFIVADVGIRGSKSRTTILQTLGSRSAGTGFPGGLALDEDNTLLVDNQYAGTIETFAEPWTGCATSMLAWGYDPDDYTGIALDLKSHVVWAANIHTVGSVATSYGVANSYPLGSIGNATAPAVADQYVGIIVSPEAR